MRILVEQGRIIVGTGGVKVMIIDQLYDDLFHNLDMERSDQDSSILRQRQL
jgi:hypothetical protein